MPTDTLRTPTADGRFDPSRVDAFRFVGTHVDPGTGTVELHYDLVGDGLDPALSRFTETFVVPDVAPERWDDPRVQRAVQLLFLLAGVSYHKTAAPDVLDLGDTPVGAADRDLVLATYTDGLAEFSFRNGIDGRGRRLVGGRDLPPAEHARFPVGRPLLPFGGGMDSLVSVDVIGERVAAGAVGRDDADGTAVEDLALFVMSPDGRPSAVIERAAAATGLPVLRATRRLDPKVFRSAELGYRNGHVPVTGIVSALALLVAACHGRGAVVMSNEASASVAQQLGGAPVNHQWSKSWAFEQLLRASLAERGTGAAYFSLLRDRSENWIAARFATSAERFHHVFVSCNRAFAIDPERRTDGWCRACDKCLFMDLVLAPHLSPGALVAIFDGAEPLTHPDRELQLRTLLDLPAGTRPFECVGDVHECRAALLATAAREDRDEEVLRVLAAELAALGITSAADLPVLDGGEHAIPSAYRADADDPS